MIQEEQLEPQVSEAENEEKAESPLRADDEALQEEAKPAVEKEAAAKEAPEPEVDWKDRYLRLAADFDNYRKRNLKEQAEMRRTERSRVTQQWLEVVDSVERALAGQESAPDNPYFVGLEAISRQMAQVITSLGYKKVSTDGLFDPHKHEALARIPAEAEQEDGAIAYVDRAGFITEDGYVVRPARVVVAKK